MDQKGYWFSNFGRDWSVHQTQQMEWCQDCQISSSSTWQMKPKHFCTNQFSYNHRSTYSGGMRGDSLPWDIQTIKGNGRLKEAINEKLQQFHTILFPENMRAQSLHIIILPTQYAHVLASSTEIVVQWDSYNYTLLSVVQCMWRLCTPTACFSW